MSGPLAGWRVLVPAPAGRRSALPDLLRAAGAEPQVTALLAFEPPDDDAALDLAVAALAAGDYAWAAFTSVTAVTAVLGRVQALSVTVPVPADTRVAAVGPATAAALRAGGVPVDLVPARGSAADLVAAWPTAAGPLPVLLPQSAIASTVLADGLRAKGYDVDVVAAYRTVPVVPAPAVAAALAAGGFRAVLLTSPSTVTALAGIHVPTSTVVGVIGESSARAATAAGLTVSFTATEPTERALVGGLAAAATDRLEHHPSGRSL